MTDLKNPKLIFAKGFLFLILGLISMALILFENPNLRIAFLLFVAVWSIARFYYFAFYVITNYVDSEYKFRGLFDFGRYVVSKMSENSSLVSNDEH